MTKTYNPLIDPGTGDYVIENGNTVKDYSTQFPAYVRLKTQRKRWLYAPDNNYGSDFYKVSRLGKDTPRLLETITTKALQPLIDDKRAREIGAICSVVNRNQTSIEIQIIEANNEIKTFEFSPVG